MDKQVVYMYILGKFVHVEDEQISVYNAISKIITCNKLAFDGFENMRQCKELVYHGILVKNNNENIVSLYDYIYKTCYNDDYNLVWRENIEDTTTSTSHKLSINPAGDCLLYIKNSDINEILCTLTNWNSKV